MKSNCPIRPCPSCASGSEVKRYGTFFRKSDSRTIQRYKCFHCNRSFSNATFDDRFGQNKRRINVPLLQLLCKSVCMRDCAEILNVTYIKRNG